MLDRVTGWACAITMSVHATVGVAEMLHGEGGLNPWSSLLIGAILAGAMMRSIYVGFR